MQYGNLPEHSGVVFPRDFHSERDVGEQGDPETIKEPKIRAGTYAGTSSPGIDGMTSTGPREPGDDRDSGRLRDQSVPEDSDAATTSDPGLPSGTARKAAIFSPARQRELILAWKRVVALNWLAESSKRNIAENIWAALLATGLAALVGGLLAYLLIDQVRTAIATARLELDQQIAAREVAINAQISKDAVDLARTTAANELKIKLIDRAEETAEVFASVIPRQLALQRRFWEIAEENYAVRHGVGIDPREAIVDAGGSQGVGPDERRELLKEWRTQVSFIAAGELVSARTPEAKEFAVSITSCIDLLTQLDPHDLHRDPREFLADYIETLSTVPATSRAREILGRVCEAYHEKIDSDEPRKARWEQKKAHWERIGGGQCPPQADRSGSGSTEPGGEIERWTQGSTDELRRASDWLLTYRERSNYLQSVPGDDTRVPDPRGVEQAKLLSLRACRRSIEYTVDVLYTEAMGVIGKSIQTKINEILLEPADESDADVNGSSESDLGDDAASASDDG